MPSWRDDKILELANQLTYSPADKRQEQLQAAIELLPDIDPLKIYPWDFVYFRITNIQLRGHVEHAIAGKVLRADLSSFVEFLSETLALKIEEAAREGDGVLEYEDVTRKFNVSEKTIQRWRKQGLVALKYLHPDGRRRLGFLESAVRRFAAANKERVEKSAAFKQLTEEEKRTIIEMARQLAAQGGPGGGDHGATIKEISLSIARTLNRAPETVRYTIRRHDKEHPEAAVFGEEKARARGEAEEPIQGGDSGGTTDAMCRAVAEDAGEAARKAAAGNDKIEYVHNPLFEHPEAEHILLTVLPAEALVKAQATVNAGVNAKAADVYMARMPRDLPAFLQDIFRQPVMPQELETDAFRRMNYLKFRAAQTQIELAGEWEDAPLFAALKDGPGANAQGTLGATLETFLARAGELKNLILQSNLRVAVHVARKHQRADRPLIELVSDATIWLMRAIETFDFSRPTRFSTYAGYAIMKNFARDRVEQLTRRDRRLMTGQQEVLNEIGDRESAGVGEWMDAAHLRAELRAVIEELSEKEKELLKNHYGLDENSPALSLAQIGDKMGISKARVKQLEERALVKLRGLLESRRQKLQRAWNGK